MKLCSYRTIKPHLPAFCWLISKILLEIILTFLCLTPQPHPALGWSKIRRNSAKKMHRFLGFFGRKFRICDNCCQYLEIGNIGTSYPTHRFFSAWKGIIFVVHNGEKTGSIKNKKGSGNKRHVTKVHSHNSGIEMETNRWESIPTVLKIYWVTEEHCHPFTIIFCTLQKLFFDPLPYWIALWIK